MRLALRRVVLRAVASFVLGAVAVAVCSSRADAQTIGIVHESSLPRVDADGYPIPKRSPELTPEGINRQDCLDDQQIHFTLQLTGLEGGETLQFWASDGGEDCALESARDGGAARCWQVAVAAPSEAFVDLDLPVRKLISGMPPFAPSAPAPDAAACGHVDFSTVSVQIFLYRSEAEPPVARAATDIPVDTVGPPPPSFVTAFPEGADSLNVSWQLPRGLSGISGFDIFCERLSFRAACATSSLAASRRPDLAVRRRCAGVRDADARQMTVKPPDGRPIEADIPIAVAVAAVDGFENFGELSRVQCVMPLPLPPEMMASPETTDGGSCAAAPAPSGGVPVFVGATVALALLACARRRKTA